MSKPIRVSCGVLLLGNYRPTLAVARTLAPLGYQITVAGRGGEGTAEYSRHVKDHIAVVPRADDRESALPWLKDLLASRPDIEVVITVRDDWVRLVAEEATELGDAVLWVTPQPDSVIATVDKTAMFTRCTELGVPVEPFSVVSRSELGQGLRDVGLPAVIRPLQPGLRLSRRKAIFVERHDDPSLAALDAAEPGTALIVQRQAGGHRRNLYFTARRGRIVAVTQSDIHCTDRVDGGGLTVEGVTSMPRDDLLGWTSQLLASLDYTGIGCAQFMSDAKSGRASSLEINPRIVGSHAVAEAAGVPLAALAVALARGDPVDPGPMVGTSGIAYAWTYGDIRGLAVERLLRRVGPLAALRWSVQMIRAVYRSHLHMIWDRSDPISALALLARQAGLEGLARLVARAGSAIRSAFSRQTSAGQSRTTGAE